jgi:flagellar P-ring protein precursor FlgI
MRIRTIAAILALLVAAVQRVPAVPVRLKDMASLEGVRENQLLGYGIVVGLNGTGDKRQPVFPAQTLANLLEKMGVQVDPTAIQIRNTAAVMVTANLPAFAQPGVRIDINVAAIGDATNLQGGLLLMTSLKGANGVVYAVAQGSVVTEGFATGRGGGNSTTVNHPTAGRAPGGAIIEQAAPSVMPVEKLRWQLKQADFTTAARLAAVVNQRFQASIANCESSGVVVVRLPDDWKTREVEFIAEIEALTLETDRQNRIVINERTGTIVLGRDIVIHPISILHGNLSVQVQTTLETSQPNPLSGGETVVTPKVEVTAKEESARNVTLKKGATVEDLVKALMALGSTPRDVIAVLENLRVVGALESEIEVI